MADPTLHAEPNYCNGFLIIHFGPSEVLDSGALDHMTGNLGLLTDIKEHFTPVLMPHGFVVESHKKATMRIAIPTSEEGTNFHIIPLLNTPLVPGSHSHLSSIPVLNVSRILAKFDTAHAYITINGRCCYKQPTPSKIPVTRTPFCIEFRIFTTCNIPYCQGQIKDQSPLELMHRRMGHHSFKSIIVAETAKAWKDVVAQQMPDEHCT